jgi:hypothetical protein
MGVDSSRYDRGNITSSSFFEPRQCRQTMNQGVRLTSVVSSDDFESSLQVMHIKAQLHPSCLRLISLIVELQEKMLT